MVKKENVSHEWEYNALIVHISGILSWSEDHCSSLGIKAFTDLRMITGILTSSVLLPLRQDKFMEKFRQKPSQYDNYSNSQLPCNEYIMPKQYVFS